MNKNVKVREELLQALIEKMVNVLKSLHGGSHFPFGDFQLSRLQVMIVFFIAKKERGVSAKELAQFLNVTSGAVTQFVDILVKKKLLKRQEDLKDRRVVRITLTKMAHVKFGEFKKKYYKSVSPAFHGFSAAEVKQFLALLSKIEVGRE